MRPDEVIDAITYTLDISGQLPDRVSYVTHEADLGGEDADLSLPIVELQPISTIHLTNFNTDFVGYKYDDDGNEIGRIYQSRYEMDVQVDVWTAARAEDNPDEIGGTIRRTLYPYTSAGPSETLLSPDGEAEEIWKFSLTDGGREDDLTMSPSIRRWRQDLEVWSYEQFDTTEDYIADVTYPDMDVQ